MLIDKLGQYQGISDDEKDAISDKIQILECKKKEFLVNEIKSCKGIYLIMKGCFRNYLLEEDKQVNYYIGFEGDFISVPDIFVLGKTSINHYIQALEDSELEFLSFVAIQDLCRSFPNLSLINTQLIAQYYLHFFSEFTKMLSLTAPQRYEKLLSQQPKILHRVSLSHIASYLGISQETLSRIRAKV